MRKHSVYIHGHRTSISLERAFWAQLTALARERGLSINALVGEVDRDRGDTNLSSALRVFILIELLKRPCHCGGCATADAGRRPR
jgi:predicted DNA-binding ribbon-helix-helix protein